MKKKVMLGVIAAMVVSMSATVFAGPSIGQIIPEAPVIVSSNVAQDAKLVVNTIDVTKDETLDSYTKNETVKTVLKEVNDENTVVSVEKVAEELKVEDVHNVETKSGEKIDLTEYKFTTPFIDLALQIGNDITYNTDGDIEAKLTIDAAKEKKAEDLVLMLVDPETGEVVFITVDEIDPKTGEIKVTLPFLGAVTLLDKSAAEDTAAAQNADTAEAETTAE